MLGGVVPVAASALAPGVTRLVAAGLTAAGLGLGVVLGALGHALWVDPAPTSPAPVEQRPAPLVAPEPIVVRPAPLVEEPVVVAPEAAPEAPTPSREASRAESSAPAGEDSLAAEMSLVSRAQTALQRGLWSSALSALDEHARRFPRGELAEEREALAIQALSRAGRGEEASRRASRFHARYPHSLLGPVVRDALDGPP